MIERIQVRVFGPKTAEVEDAGFLMKPETVRELVALFAENLAKHKSGPAQMLVEAPDMPASVVNVFRYYGKAAVAHVLRTAPTGDVAALAGIFVLLPGLDADADEAAIKALESSRDKAGKPLPFPPKVYATLRADVRPLLAMLFYTPEAVTDASLRMLGICLAQAYFASVGKAPGK